MEKQKNQKRNIVPLRELNLTSRFLYDEVMEDQETFRAALSIIFGREIPLLSQSETEKELRVSPNIRAIRMDVFGMDEEQIIYNSEMQGQEKKDIPKRSRYYQSVLDTSILEPGVVSYNELNDSYIITIMPFDPFGYKRYVYTFRAKCIEEPGCELDDGATRIFLNTHGKNDAEVSKELRDFLHYIEHTTDKAANETDSTYIKKIHDRVCKVKRNEEVGVKYMQAWEEKYYERQEGREEGRIEGSKLKLIQQVIKKLKKGKTPEMIADELEEELTVIEPICKAAEVLAPDYDENKIYENLNP